MESSKRWILTILTVLLVLPAVAGAGEQKAMLGAAIGTTGINGSSYPELAGDLRALTIGLDAMWFHSSWFLVAGDFSKALNSERKITNSSGSGNTWEGSAWYVDLLAGARHKTASGSFMYLAAGLTVSGGEYSMTMIRSNGTTDSINADISEAIGFVAGAGLSVQAGKNTTVFLRLRHRIVVADSEFSEIGDTDSVQSDFDLGGLETAVGVGFML